VLCKLAGDADEVTAVHILFPKSLQIAIDEAFQHARRMH
jgi:hypothetical protein